MTPTLVYQGTRFIPDVTSETVVEMAATCGISETLMAHTHEKWKDPLTKMDLLLPRLTADTLEKTTEASQMTQENSETIGTNMSMVAEAQVVHPWVTPGATVPCHTKIALHNRGI